LHGREGGEEPCLVGVGFESRGFQGAEQLVDGLECGEAERAWLGLDQPAAGSRGFEHEPRKAQKARAFAEHGLGAGPGGIHEKGCHPSPGGGGGESPARSGQGEIDRILAGVEEDGKIRRIVDEFAHSRVEVECHSGYDFRLVEVEAGQPSRAAAFAAPLLGMHEKHDFRAQAHGGAGRAEAGLLRAKARQAQFTIQGWALLATLYSEAVRGGYPADPRGG